MILSDFLSRQTHDVSNPHEIIPISFNMYNVLYETYYKIETKDWYLVQTQSQTKVAGITLLTVHGARKALTTKVLPERPKPQIHIKQVDKNRPKLWWGRAGIRWKNPNLLLIQQHQWVNQAKYLQFKKLPKIVWISQYQKN